MECQSQFSRCIISISISHHLVRMANTHDHELCSSLSDNRRLPPHLLPGTKPISTSRRLIGRIQARDRMQTELLSSSSCCQKDEKLFRATLLKAASHHIPTGKYKLYTQQVPAEILAMMEERDELWKQDPASPRLSTMNDEITKATSDHKRRQWREFVESIDHMTDSTKLWRTIKGIYGKSQHMADNEGVTFT